MATVNYTALIAGRVDYAVNTIAAGENIAAGQVLGKITASGQYGKADITAADGTETAVCVAAAAVDTTANGTNAATAVRCIVSGRVNNTELVFNGAETINSAKANQKTHREALQDNGIFAVQTDAAITQERA